MDRVIGATAWYARQNAIEKLAAWVLALLWISPLAFAFWAAFHDPIEVTRFHLLAPLTLHNFVSAWEAAPFARYFLNTVMVMTLIIVVQFTLSTLAGYAFARFQFPGHQLAFI